MEDGLLLSQSTKVKYCINGNNARNLSQMGMYKTFAIDIYFCA